MQDSGGDETALLGMLMTSAVAMFFSCSGATRFSEIRFDSESSVLYSRPQVGNPSSKTQLPNQSFWTLAGFFLGRMKLVKVMSRLPSWGPSYQLSRCCRNAACAKS